MKKLVIISAVVVGLGFGCQQASHVAQPEAAAVSYATSVNATPTAVEAPVMDVLLDTVEITAVSSKAMATR